MQGISARTPVSIMRHLSSITPVLRNRFGVKQIGVFGSFARGEETSKSDIDILVDLADGSRTLRNFVALADYLESLLHLRVDLVTVEGLDPYIRSQVETEVIWVEE